MDKTSPQIGEITTLDLMCKSFEFKQPSIVGSYLKNVKPLQLYDTDGDDDEEFF